MNVSTYLRKWQAPSLKLDSDMGNNDVDDEMIMNFQVWVSMYSLLFPPLAQASHSGLRASELAID